MRPKRALVVTYTFPPVGGAGVQRIAKLVKYLPEFGWEPTVLTVANPSVPAFDASLLAGIPAQTPIVRVRTLEPRYAVKRFFSAGAHHAGSSNGFRARATRACRAAANIILQPDPQILWRRAAVRAALRVMAVRSHDVIFVTAPPFSSFLIGAELGRRTRLPLVLDFRDEWTINQTYEENREHTRWALWRQRRMQQAVLRAASAVIGSTKRSAQRLKQIALVANANPIVTCIYNGFDSADLKGRPDGRTTMRSGRESGRNVYKLAHVGTLWSLTSIEPMVEAVVRLSEWRPDLSSRLELHVAGRRTAHQDSVLHRLDGLPCRLVTYPYLNHDAALQLMQSADALLLLLSDVPDAERVVPAKLFEYLALGRPMYAVVPRGEVDELLRDSPTAFVHSPRDIDGLAVWLGRQIETNQHARSSVPADRYGRFERRALTGELATLLDRVCWPKTGPVTEVPATEVSV